MDEHDAIISEYEQLLQIWKRRCAGLEANLRKLETELELARKDAASWKECATLGYPQIITKWMEATYGTDPR